MSAELKPCPFCGEAPGDVGYVFCMSAHDCPAVQIGTSAEQWNRRAPSPDLAALRAENERLRADLAAMKDAMEDERQSNMRGGYIQALEMLSVEIATRIDDAKKAEENKDEPMFDEDGAPRG